MMKTRALILVIFFLCVFPAGSDADSLYEKMKKGNELFEQGKHDESLNTFVDAQIEFPEDPKLKYNIASAHYKMKNYEEAVKGYLDVAATAQNAQLEEKALYNIGNAMYRQGKLQEAVEYYKKALELDPEDKDAKQNLEFVLEEIKRRINEAKKTAQKQQQKKDQQKQKQEGSGQGEQKQQQGQDEKQQQQDEGKEDKEQGGGEQQQMQADKKEKEDEQAEGSSMHAREMTEEEAEQWLDSIQEDRDKFKKKDQKARGGRRYRSEKDW